MKKHFYRCNVAEAGDMHSVYTRASLPKGNNAESTVYIDTEYGNTARVELKNLLSNFADPPFKSMGKQCAMLDRGKMICYK